MPPTTHRGPCFTTSAGLPCRRAQGYSVTELVIVISIMGVLASVVVMQSGQFLSSSKDVMAATRQELLNHALYSFAQQNNELLFSSSDGAVTDEMYILRTLQYRDPNLNRATIGSPYIDPRYNPIASSDDASYRLRWTGRMFELLLPGQSGTGLFMDFDGADFTTPFAFPANFQTAGH